MDDSSAASTVADIALRIFRAIWSFPWARAALVISYPVRLALVPIARLVAFVLGLFAPVGYILGYLLTCARAVAAFLVSLEPLYTFFSVAAFVGLVAGIIMAVASSLLTSYLGMQDDDEPLYTPRTIEGRHHKMRGLPASKSPHGLEPDWYWGEPSSPVRLRRISGLQAQTIHEDEDEESEL